MKPNYKYRNIKELPKMSQTTLFEKWVTSHEKQTAKRNWEQIPQGNHKCKVYFKHKNGKTLLDSIYVSCKILTKKDVEFLNGKTTRNNIQKKLAMIKDAEDTTVDFLKLEQRYFENTDFNTGMLNDIIEDVNRCIAETGSINISKDVNFKIVVKIVE